MALDHQKAIYHLNKDSKLFVVFTTRIIPGKDKEKPKVIPRNPYVRENQVSYSDQALIFTEEKDIVAYCQRIKDEEKQFLIGVSFERKLMNTLFNQLYCVGVDSLIFNDRGEEAEVELSEVFKPKDYSALPKGQQPLINQTLALSIQYFFEELALAIPMDKRTEEQKKSLMSRQEEMVANLVKSEVLIPAQPLGDDKKISVLVLKKNDKDGNAVDNVLPVFTDSVELEKYTKGQKTAFVRIPFKDIEKLMPPNCNVLLNIASTELTIKKEAVDRMTEAAPNS